MSSKSQKLLEEFRKLDTQTKRKLDQIIRRLETDPVLGKPLRGNLSGAREGCGDSRSHLAKAHMSSR